MMAGFPRKEILFGRNGAPVNGIKEGIVARAGMGEQEADTKEFLVGGTTSCLIGKTWMVHSQNDGMEMLLRELMAGAAPLVVVVDETACRPSD
jgi:hypothetical protein